MVAPLIDSHLRIWPAVGWEEHGGRDIRGSQRKLEGQREHIRENRHTVVLTFVQYHVILQFKYTLEIQFVFSSCKTCTNKIIFIYIFKQFLLPGSILRHFGCVRYGTECSSDYVITRLDLMSKGGPVP